MEVHKSFVTLDNIATITCPQCHRAKKIDVAKYKTKTHTIKAKCSCGHAFSALLDFRRHYRKDTNLDGTYSMISPAFGKGAINILNISRSGVGFAIGLSAGANHAMEMHQKARISFELDNRKQTIINKVITIINVNNQYVGGEFDDNQTLDKDLGFYLQP